MSKKIVKAAFLDRDGVINEDNGYIYKWEDFIFFPKTLSALKNLISLNYSIIIITNQSGIARGYYTESDLKLLHTKLINYLLAKNIEILDVFYCPHFIKGKIKKYAIECECRKPKSGMIKKAIQKYNLSPENCLLVGDKKSDIEAGLNSNIKFNYLLENKKDILSINNKNKTFDSLWNLSKYLLNNDPIQSI